MKIRILAFLSLVSFSAFASQGGDDAGNGGNEFLRRSPVNQYTCMKISLRVDSHGNMVRDGFARTYQYYLNEVLPSPIDNTTSYLCHDEQTYGGIDSVEYPRLELITNWFSLFGRFDSRFQINSNGKLQIDEIIEKRMVEEFNINYSSNMFNKYSLSEDSFGYILKPLQDIRTKRFFCPSNENLAVSPVVKVVTAFTGQTQGLYQGYMETQKLPNNELVYSKLLVKEQDLLKYGFFLRDGVKIKISYEDQIETEMVFFYYPFSNVIDPLVKGARKIVTVNFNGGNNYTKKIGCIFMREN